MNLRFTIPYDGQKCTTVLLLITVIVLLFRTSHTLSISSDLPTMFGDSLGINCRGSILCPAYLEAFPPDYIGTFIRIATGSATDCLPDFSCGPLNDTDLYLPNDHIMCLPLGRSFLGGICAFTQGRKVPTTGVDGVLIKRKLQELRGHGCRVCGSVPLSGDNDPGSQGILTVNYIGGVACKGLCPSKHYTTSSQSRANGTWLPATSSNFLES